MKPMDQIKDYLNFNGIFFGIFELKRNQADSALSTFDSPSVRLRYTFRLSFGLNLGSLNYTVCYATECESFEI